jgi:hypothetical protein
VALHACDTATDDALRAGISAGARVIIVAPCCHKELRGQMDGPWGQQRSAGVLQDVFAYGILAGRMAETTTDAIRALLLQIMGYRTQVFEFIDGVHTAKNVMITAIRKDAGKLTAKEEEEEAGRRAALRSRLAELMGFFGVGVQRLAMLLGENPETDNPRYLHQVPACLRLIRSYMAAGRLTLARNRQMTTMRHSNEQRERFNNGPADARTPPAAQAGRHARSGGRSLDLADLAAPKDAASD